MEVDRAVVLVLRPAIDLAGVLSEGGVFFYSADGFDDLFDLVQELFGLIDEVVLRVEHGTHDVQNVVAHFLWRPSGQSQSDSSPMREAPMPSSPSPA
jgi:hypothetical protein